MARWSLLPPLPLHGPNQLADIHPVIHASSSLDEFKTTLAYQIWYSWPEKGKSEFSQSPFYRTATGREPVREWLKQTDPAHRKRIGEDLYTLQLGWPVGMPFARKLEPNLWEFRSHISDGIVRIMFTEKKDVLILLHGFIRKSQKLAASELALAKERLATLRTKRES